jgi:hypothetical protein
MLIVERVNGTPKLRAARAARISPSPLIIPASPVGAKVLAHGAGGKAFNRRNSIT